MSGYLSGYLGERAVEYLSGLFDLFIQDPVMPSQEPPSDAKSEEVDLPPDDTEDTDESKTLKPSSILGFSQVWLQYMLVCLWE